MSEPWRFSDMEEEDARYEVVFAPDAVVSDTARGTFRWSWLQIRADGFVAVHGKTYANLRAAIGGAAEYRREHGGGQIRVNIQEMHRQDAQDAVYLH